MSQLKLPKLPDRTPIKLTITITPDLNERLHRYSTAYLEEYGTQESIAELVPAMLDAFLLSDRQFMKRQHVPERGAQA